MRFAGHRTPVPNVDSGASFNRRRGNQIVEIAKVINVSPDAAGILHVRFNLRMASARTADEAERTLSLEYFRSLYGEPATA